MDEDLLVACRLSKEGFGTPEEILKMRADIVLAALEFSNFQGEYQETYTQLNKEPRK